MALAIAARTTVSVLRVIGLILPLSLDTFAVSAALGLTARRRGVFRLSLIFAGFETLMPLVGLLAGHTTAHAIGRNSDYVAGALLVLVGVWIIFGEEDERITGALDRQSVLTLGLLGLSISLDELAIGFGAGLLRLPLLVAAPLIAVQALVASQLGFRLGGRLSRAAVELTEQAAGTALVALGLLFFGLAIA